MTQTSERGSALVDTLGDAVTRKRTMYRRRGKRAASIEPTTPRDRLPCYRQPAEGERVLTGPEIEAALVGRLSRTQRRALIQALSGVAIVVLIEASPILGEGCEA